MSKYLKAISVLLVGIVGWATAVTQSDPARITSAEWIGLATVFVGVFTVYIVPNSPPVPPPHPEA